MEIKLCVEEEKKWNIYFTRIHEEKFILEKLYI